MESKEIIKTESKVNPMKEIKIEKIVVNVGATGEDLEKGFKLLKLLTKRNPAKMMSQKRIPSWGVRPRLEVGAVVTLRKDLETFLKKMLAKRMNVYLTAEEAVKLGIYDEIV